ARSAYLPHRTGASGRAASRGRLHRRSLPHRRPRPPRPRPRRRPHGPRPLLAPTRLPHRSHRPRRRPPRPDDVEWPTAARLRLTIEPTYRLGMDRRRFLLTALAGAVVAPRAVEAQPAGKVAQVGYLSLGTATTNAELRKAFIDGLRDHGWLEGKNLSIEYRWQGAGKSTLDALAAELARLPLDVIFAVNTPASLATKRTGTTRPVVFAQVSEPVAIGLVDTLSRPGRNFTGLTTINRELMSKRLELLKETIPGLTRVGYLANPGYEVRKPQLTEMIATARSLGLTLHLAEVRAPSEFEGAFARMTAAHVGAFVVQQDDLFVVNRPVVIDRA